MRVAVRDSERLDLGEGPLWHPERRELFVFDINRGRLKRCPGDAIDLGKGAVSAAGWTGRDSLLIACETGLFEYNLDSGAATWVVDIEADDPATRSNDGRADAHGGFWIGFMAKSGAAPVGSIYRYCRGELRKLRGGMRIPNSICFSPDGGLAYYADTVDGRIFSQRLDARGWPEGDPELFRDLRPEGLKPDGSVVAADGTLWNAQYGAARVAVHAPDGGFLFAREMPARQTTCPAFGGPGLKTLFCTSAAQDLDNGQLAEDPKAGMTFETPAGATGQAEHRVVL